MTIFNHTIFSLVAFCFEDSGRLSFLIPSPFTNQTRSHHLTLSRRHGNSNSIPEWNNEKHTRSLGQRYVVSTSCYTHSIPSPLLGSIYLSEAQEPLRQQLDVTATKMDDDTTRIVCYLIVTFLRRGLRLTFFRGWGVLGTKWWRGYLSSNCDVCCLYASFDAITHSSECRIIDGGASSDTSLVTIYSILLWRIRCSWLRSATLEMSSTLERV